MQQRIIAWSACPVALTALLTLTTPAPAVIWNVSTVAELNTAVQNATSGDEIVIQPGTYNLTQYLNLNHAGVTVRGSTGNRDDVILVGGGMNTRGIDEGLLVNTDNLTIRDLTLKDFYFNAIHIRAENDADGTLISNVKTWNIGERHVKGSGGGWPSAVSDNVVIENLYMLQTQPRTGHPDTNPDYIGGIDCMGVRNWIIRDCVAEGIVGELNGGNAAIFLWQGVQGATIERNVIIACTKGIALGNPSGPKSGIFTDPWHAVDVIIRNNFILRGPWTTGNNISIELCNTKDVRVYHNSVYSEDASYFRTLSIWDEAGEGLTTNLQMVNNIIRGHIKDYTVAGGWSDADVAAMGNLVHGVGGLSIAATWFVDPSNADFHLTGASSIPIDAAQTLAEVPEDIDRQSRPHGAQADFGADEFVPRGDLDHDGDVDLDDWTLFVPNLMGPAQPPADPQADLDGDADADLADIARFVANFTGPL